MHQHISRVIEAGQAAETTGPTTTPAAQADGEAAAKIDESGSTPAGLQEPAESGAASARSSLDLTSTVPAATDARAASAANAGTAAAGAPAAAGGGGSAAAGGARERVDNMLDDLQDLVYVPRGYICSSTQVCVNSAQDDAR